MRKINITHLATEEEGVALFSAAGGGNAYSFVAAAEVNVEVAVTAAAAASVTAAVSFVVSFVALVDGDGALADAVLAAAAAAAVLCDFCIESCCGYTQT